MGYIKMDIENVETSSLDLGIELFKKKQYDLARLEFLEVATSKANNEKVEANLYLGKIAFRNSKETCISGENYMNYVIYYGNTFQREQAYFELATKNRLQKNLPEAIKLYNKCLEIFPNDAYVLTALANLYLKLEDMAKAQSLYLRLLDDKMFYSNSKKKQISHNIAYLGLAKISFRQNNIPLFKKYLAQVEPLSKRDIELKNDLEANLFFYYEQYQKAIAKLSLSLNSDIPFVRKSTKEKIAIIKAIEPNIKENNKAYEFFRMPLTRAGCVALATIYKQDKKYQDAYHLYNILALKEPKYLLDALECAMHFDEILAIKTISKLILVKVDSSKYLNYAIYLMKKFNITFPGIDYKNMPLVAEELIRYDEEKVKNNASFCCLLNYREGYNWDYVYNGLIKKCLDNANDLENVTYIAGSIYDTYIINIPFLALDYKDYLVVITYKNSKTPIEITAKSKIELEKFTPSSTIKNDENVRKLFR